MSKYWDEMHEAKKDRLVLTGRVRFLQNNGASVTSSEGSRIEGSVGLESRHLTLRSLGPGSIT